MTEQTKTYTKDDIRAAIFAAEKPNSKVIEVFGINMELRQPSMGEILDLGELPTVKERVVSALMYWCYVPGTNEKIFAPADKDVLLNKHMGKDFTKIQAAISELSDVDIESAEKNLEEAPEKETS